MKIFQPSLKYNQIFALGVWSVNAVRFSAIGSERYSGGVGLRCENFLSQP
jgi:hypothetical protein